jgi:hypothetical protein
MSVLGMLRAQLTSERAAIAAMERNRMGRSNHGEAGQSIGGRRARLP